MQNIDNAIQIFRLNVASVEQLHRIYMFLSLQNSQNFDLSELLRAEIALIVSALDCFVHDIVRLGTLEIYSGNRPFTNTSFSPDYDTRKFVNLLTRSKDEQLQEIEKTVRDTNKNDAYQNPDKINKALAGIGIENIWTIIASRLGIDDAGDVKRQLELIIRRRNAIVHEGDINPDTNQKAMIDSGLVQDNINFIITICETIYEQAILP